MELSVYFGSMKQDQDVQAGVSELMHESFERYRNYIRCVSVTVTDINGPRGGVDKECRCVVHLKRMSPVVILDRDESFVQLLTRVANRAAHTLSQKVDRKQASFRTRKRLVDTVDLPKTDASPQQADALEPQA